MLGTGTSQGVPIIGCDCAVCHSADPRDHRLRTSAFVNVDGWRILIDSGMDLRQQLLRENILEIDAVLLTHEHKDHLGGLDDIRPINFRMNEPINIYGQKRVLNIVTKDYDYAFRRHKYPGVPSFTLHPVAKEPFFLGEDLQIIPIQVKHLELPILGYRIKDFAYITDASFISDTEKRKLHGLEVLIINALRIKEHYSHFNLEQALSVIDELQPKRAFLTHLSHEIGTYQFVSSLLPSHVAVGYDGLKIRI